MAAYLNDDSQRAFVDSMAEVSVPKHEVIMRQGALPTQPECRVRVRVRARLGLGYVYRNGRRLQSARCCRHVYRTGRRLQSGSACACAGRLGSLHTTLLPLPPRRR